MSAEHRKPSSSKHSTSMASAATQAMSAGTSQNKRPRKATRPSYAHIHRNLLPIEVHPLPILIPHNPLSLVAIALSYLTQLLSPPQRTTYNGYFSSATSSIHVTDPVAVRALWEMGFFGRGNLSRSEPMWLESQKKKGATAEENTSKRRNERRQQKLERARKEQLDIEDRLRKEKLPSADGLKSNEDDLASIASVLDLAESTEKSSPVGTEQGQGLPDETTPSPTEHHTGDTTPDAREVNEKVDEFEEWRKAIDANGLPTPPPTSTCSEASMPESRPVKRLQRQKTVRFSPTIEAREFDLSAPTISPIKSPGSSSVSESAEVDTAVKAVVENKEHLQLSLEEAFFLSYALGVLTVYCDDSDAVLPPSSLLSLSRRHSYHPPRSLSIAAEPSDPFLISYSVYHHYRSLGWVVRSGVKFGVDYLLYNRGPAFSHAEFAVVVLPSYLDEYWNGSDEQREALAQKNQKTWSWLHGTNRVQAQVHKQLVLCYVDVPPPLKKVERGTDLDIGGLFSRYTIRDVAVRRWTPNRSRD